MKFNVNRVDNMVIQAIFLLDTLDKDVNSFSMRVRLVCFSHQILFYFSVLCTLHLDGLTIINSEHMFQEL